MMYVKIMSGEDLPDGSSSKGFLLVACESVVFRRRAGGLGDSPDTSYAVAEITCADRSGEETITTTQSIDMTGNAYVLGESGKTLGSFAYSLCRSA